MKRSLKLTALSILVLAVAGGLSADLLAAADADKASPAAAEQSPANGTEEAVTAAISEHGMAAINDIQLARLAINDGYTDNAAELLNDAEELLRTVEDETEPVTITAEVKVGDKPAEKQTVTRKPDLIPILSEVHLLEAVVEPAMAQSASGSADRPQADASAPDSKTAQSNQDQAQPTLRHSERVTASQKARKQWRNGDREGAIETLKLIELGLATRVVSMPLKETGEHLKDAISLVDKGKYHEANLALKAIEDELVVTTEIIVEPVGETSATR
jgi:hypothetical protein